jgi:hypothetical protein
MIVRQIFEAIECITFRNGEEKIHVRELWAIWQMCGSPWEVVPPKKRGKLTVREAEDYLQDLCPEWWDYSDGCWFDEHLNEIEQLRREVAELKEIERNWREECLRLYDTYIRTKPSAPAIPEHYATLHLLPGAPAEVVNAAHKALVKLHHPDRGGDTATMQAINAAADQVRKEVQQ